MRVEYAVRTPARQKFRGPPHIDFVIRLVEAFYQCFPARTANKSECAQTCLAWQSWQQKQDKINQPALHYPGKLAGFVL